MSDLLPIHELLNQIAAANKGAGAAAASLQDLFAKAAAVASEDVALQTSVGANAQIISRAKQSSDLAIQAASNRAAAIFGTDLKAQGEQITALSQTMREQYQVADEAVKRVQQKSSVGFFDNPLEYIVNQLTIDEDKSAAETAKQRADMASAQLAKINSSTQSTITTQRMLDTSITEASIAATDQNIAALAKIKANEATLKAFAYGENSINAALRADQTILSNNFTAYNAVRQNEQIQMQREQMAFQVEKFKQDREERNIAKSADSAEIATINAGKIALDGPGAVLIPDNSAQAKTALALLRSNSPAGRELSNYYIAGSMSQKKGERVIAVSAAEAVAVMNTQSVALKPEQKAIKDILERAYGESLSGHAVIPGTNQPLDVKNASQVKQYINLRTAELLKSYGEKIVPGDPENPFNIATVKTLIEQSPSLQRNSAVQKLAAMPGVDLDNPSNIGATVLELIRTGKMTWSEAMTVPQIWQTGVEVNKASRQFSAFGLDGIVPNSYNVQLGGKTVNVADTGEWSKWLNRQLVFSIESSKDLFAVPFQAGNAFRQSFDASATSYGQSMRTPKGNN